MLSTALKGKQVIHAVLAYPPRRTRVIFKVTKPEQIPGKGKLDDGTMLSTVGLINAKAAALHPVKMCFGVAGPEQDLSLIETPNGRAQLDDLASRGSIGSSPLLRDWKFG